MEFIFVQKGTCLKALYWSFKHLIFWNGFNLFFGCLFSNKILFTNLLSKDFQISTSFQDPYYRFTCFCILSDYFKGSLKYLSFLFTSSLVSPFPCLYIITGKGEMQYTSCTKFTKIFYSLCRNWAIWRYGWKKTIDNRYADLVY